LKNKGKVRVIFICMGNICRSPTAHGVFEQLVDSKGLSEQIFTDSAGTHAYHIGESPDPRSQATALENGVDISKQRAQKVTVDDFKVFDYIIAMDRSNYQDLQQLAPNDLQHKVYRFMAFAPDWDVADVPDPYYGAGDGFATVFKMVKAASDGLLAHILDNKQLGVQK
jgi:protein-tyrosine phosphatase